MRKRPLIWIILAALALFGFVGLSHAAQVTLAWDANTPAPDGYRIYQRLHGGSYGEPIWTGTDTTCTITGLAEGSYYFVARAFRGAVESGNSNEVAALVEAPTPTPAPTIDPTPAPPRGFMLLKDGAPIPSLSAGQYTAQDNGKLWIVEIRPSEAPFSGNIVTKTFHREGCRYHGCLTCLEKFSTREDAIAAGFKPCGSCKP